VAREKARLGRRHPRLPAHAYQTSGRRTGDHPQRRASGTAASARALMRGRPAAGARRLPWRSVDNKTPRRDSEARSVNNATATILWSATSYSAAAPLNRVLVLDDGPWCKQGRHRSCSLNPGTTALGKRQRPKSSCRCLDPHQDQHDSGDFKTIGRTKQLLIRERSEAPTCALSWIDPVFTHMETTAYKLRCTLTLSATSTARC